MTGVGEITGKDGMFMMGGVEYDLETLVMTLQMERVELLDKQIEDRAKEMKRRNMDLDGLRKVIDTLNGAFDDYGQGPQFHNGNVWTHSEKVKGMTPPITIDNYLKGHGIDLTSFKTGGAGGHMDANARKNAIASVRGKMDTLNSESQLDMIGLQSLMNKRNQAFELMTNVISKMNKPKETIIANMR